MPATLQPVIVTPSLPLLLAFYKALLGAVEISRMPGGSSAAPLRPGPARCDIGPAITGAM